MFRLLRAYWPELLAALLVILIIRIVGSSESFQKCVESSQKYISGQPAQKVISSIPITFGIYRDCTGRFIHDENPAIIALATLLIAVFTGTPWHATRGMLKACAEQGAAMDRSITESARAASAMERVAQHFADNVSIVRERSAQQMRAYLGVSYLGVVPQDNVTNYRFEVRCVLINRGATPAHNTS